MRTLTEAKVSENTNGGGVVRLAQSRVVILNVVKNLSEVTCCSLNLKEVFHNK